MVAQEWKLSSLNVYKLKTYDVLKSVVHNGSQQKHILPTWDIKYFCTNWPLPLRPIREKYGQKYFFYLKLQIMYNRCSIIRVLYKIEDNDADPLL